MPATIRNIITIARREYSWRAQSRLFIGTTLLLAVVGVAVTLSPVLIRYFTTSSTGDRIGLYVERGATEVDLAAALDRVLNITVTSPLPRTDTPSADFVIEPVSDLEAGRADVEEGDLKALLAVRRLPTGELGFDLYSGMQSFERTPQLIQQATTSIVIQDRLTKAGIPPIDQASLFAPPSFAFHGKADGDGGSDSAGSGDSEEDFGTKAILGFALAIFIFMAIILYGQWVAMSVAEEKSSRVMEVVLGGATPFQLLAGKVVGNGALGLTQYVVVGVPAAIAILFQDRIASLILGDSAAATELPAGLTVGVLLAFGVMFVLGFMLYAVLYAGAASLVTRMEDVNQVIGPLTLLSVAGYMISVYAGSGIIDLSAPVITVLTYVPFLTPYLLLSRLAIGEVAPWEPFVGVAVLLVAIVAALWFAARLYEAGVLMYGQKPSLRNFVKAFRAG